MSRQKLYLKTKIYTSVYFKTMTRTSWHQGEMG